MSNHMDPDDIRTIVHIAEARAWIKSINIGRLAPDQVKAVNEAYAHITVALRGIADGGYLPRIDFTDSVEVRAFLAELDEQEKPVNLGEYYGVEPGVDFPSSL